MRRKKPEANEMTSATTNGGWRGGSRRGWLFVFIGCKRDEVILVYFALIKHNGTLSELMSVVLECDKS